MCDPQVRFCERPGGESPRAYSTGQGRRDSGAGGRYPNELCRRAVTLAEAALTDGKPVARFGRLTAEDSGAAPT